MENKFLELTSSSLMNLEHTKRYSGTKLVEEESLSQHIVDTIMMGLKIIDYINVLLPVEEHIDSATYVMKAVYHDLEEVITGDIPRPVKYYDEDTKSSLKNVADQVARRFFNEEFNYGTPHYDIWDKAKEGAAGYILKLVDTLVVAHKVIKEVSLLHNFYMLRVAHEVSRYLEEIYEDLNSSQSFGFLCTPGVKDYISSVVFGAFTSMNKLLVEHADIMKDLNIYKQSMIKENSDV